MNLLNNVEQIKDFFITKTCPIYFFGCTFNLIGMERWMSNVKFIAYEDFFDGCHPNSFSPKEELDHEIFNNYIDVNNYLLSHPEVIEFIYQHRKSTSNSGKAVFLMFDKKTEMLAKQLNLEICLPSFDTRNFFDNKLMGNRIAQKAGIPCVPFIASKINSYSDVKKCSIELGSDLVIQAPYGDSGDTTFFISNERDYLKYATKIENEEVVKVMKRINCQEIAIEGCTTQYGTMTGTITTELIGFQELTPNKGGWCGNEICKDAFDDSIREKVKIYVQKYGEELRKEGYRGYFELDFLFEKDSNEVFFGELNPRISGITNITNNARFAKNDLPLFLYHLLDLMKVSFKIDANFFKNNLSKEINYDDWSQLAIKHTSDEECMIFNAPKSGIWKMKNDGSIFYKDFSINQNDVAGCDEAFFIRTIKEGNKVSKGQNLGILMMRGRLMTQDYTLTERAKKWIQEVRSQYNNKIIPLIDKQRKKQEKAGVYILRKISA